MRVDKLKKFSLLEIYAWSISIKNSLLISFYYYGFGIRQESEKFEKNFDPSFNH